MSTKSIRRHLLDNLLFEHASLMKGRVLDLGGKKHNKRGSFIPPNTISNWFYLNLEFNTTPDCIGDAEYIPFKNSQFNTILMCEVLEHLHKPRRVIYEIARTLKMDGILILTIPFLYPVHADPYDFQRWTHSKIRNELLAAGFKDIDIKPMGSVFAVTYDLFLISLKMSVGNKLIRKVLFRVITPVFFFLSLAFDNIVRKLSSKISTGYFVLACRS